MLLLCESVGLRKFAEQAAGIHHEDGEDNFTPLSTSWEGGYTKSWALSLPSSVLYLNVGLTQLLSCNQFVQNHNHAATYFQAAQMVLTQSIFLSTSQQRLDSEIKPLQDTLSGDTNDLAPYY